MNGKQEGVGIYKNVKAELRHGKWSNGKRVKWLTEKEYFDLKDTQETYFKSLNMI